MPRKIVKKKVAKKKVVKKKVITKKVVAKKVIKKKVVRKAIKKPCDYKGILIQRINNPQKAVAKYVWKELHLGNALNSDIMGMAGVSFNTLIRDHIAKAFGIAARTIDVWCRAGMPRNSDSSFELTKCINWKLNQLQIKYEQKVKPTSGQTLDDQKKEKDIEYKEAQINKIQSNYVLRSDVEENDIKKCVALREFMEDAAIKNAHQFVNLDTEGAAIALKQFCMEAAEVFSDG